MTMPGFVASPEKDARLPDEAGHQVTEEGSRRPLREGMNRDFSSQTPLSNAGNSL